MPSQTNPTPTAQTLSRLSEAIDHLYNPSYTRLEIAQSLRSIHHDLAAALWSNIEADLKQMDEDILAGIILQNFIIQPANLNLFLPTAQLIERLVRITGQSPGRPLEMLLSNTLKLMGIHNARRRVNGHLFHGYAGIQPTPKP